MEKHRLDGEHAKSILLALAAAALYAFSTPLSKLLLQSVPPVLLAGFLYLGAGVGACLVLLAGGVARRSAPVKRAFAKRDAPFVAGMIALDVLAPVLLMLGLKRAAASNAALLNNFEIVATALFALLAFRERVSKRLWLAIGLITCASCLLTFDAEGGLAFSSGSILVLLAAASWDWRTTAQGCFPIRTRILIIAIKGIGSGACALWAIGYFAGERFGDAKNLLLAMLIGCFAYGLSIACYIRAQRTLGAAKTSAHCAAALLIGTALSFLLLLASGRTRYSLLRCCSCLRARILQRLIYRCPTRGRA
ncbi:MAG: DMT family transporter [Eubacteriales bacterium]